MEQGTGAWQALILGAASVGGLLGGTCLAVKRTLGNGRARAAIIVGYMAIGMTFGLVAVACGAWIPALDVQSFRAALVMGAVFGVVGVAVMAGANLGAVLTFRYLGLKVTIEPHSRDGDS